MGSGQGLSVGVGDEEVVVLGTLGSKTILCDNIMGNTAHYAFVKSHRIL